MNKKKLKRHQNTTTILHQYYIYHSEFVKTGKVSRLSASEQLTLDAFVSWAADNDKFKIQKKGD